MENNPMTANLNLLTIKQFNKTYPIFTVGSLRALIFNADKNGFSKVIKRFSPTGKRGKILIDVVLFFEWLDEQNHNKNNGKVA